ncbi:MAG: protein kinase [Sandaracinus sp.]
MNGQLDATAPQQLGRYQLLAPIASGGMARVYVGRALGEGGFQRLVAIKRILPELADDPKFVDMFLDEGRIAGLVTSPHVVQVLDVARTSEGELFMVLDLVRGAPLHEILRAAIARGSRLEVAVVVGILAQAADGLAAAHEATSPDGVPMNIVHRDVSPQNILVGEDGRARLADFGVARALHRRSSTQTGELRGKLGYFAPEQLRGVPASVRSDVFSLGVVAWEALAGRRLFRGATPLETLQSIRALQAPSLDTLRDDVAPALAACVDRALAKSPSARFSSARELAQALRESADEASPSAIAVVVRELAGEELRRLDAKIRAALVERPTLPRAQVSATTEPSPVPSEGFEVDSDTTTQLLTPSTELSVSDLEPMTSPAATAAPSPRSRWVLVGLAGAAILGTAIGLALSDEPAPVRLPELPVAASPIPASTGPEREGPERVPLVEAPSVATAPSESAPRGRAHRADAHTVPSIEGVGSPVEIPPVRDTGRTVEGATPEVDPPSQPTAPEPAVAEPAVAEATAPEPTVAEPTVAEPTVAEPTAHERRRTLTPASAPRSGGLRPTEDFARALRGTAP